MGQKFQLADGFVMATRKKVWAGKAAGKQRVVAALKEVRAAQRQLKRAEAQLLKLLLNGPGGTQDGSG